jgi:hypothetical protein
MAGEWIPVDINLANKPETQELIDLTGQSVETVHFRLIQLWGWASLNSSDGTARVTPGRLARVCGGDEDFWLAVEAVGWLRFDREAGTAEITGWGRRFSKAAKARACAADRQSRHRNGPVTADRYETVTRGEERREQIPPPPREAAQKPGSQAADQPPGSAIADWEALRAAWNAGTGERWRSPTPPKGAAERLSEAGWLGLAADAIRHLPKCGYFKTPVTLPQLVTPGFVDRVLGGQYDRAKEPLAARFSDRPTDRPPAEGFRGDDQARFEATKRKLMDQLKAS